ncbi:unnamed protein product (macronuclear) [Paramecium tetraurelia]|uniref:Aquaporin n=1 Tax=Paramecium tetraurelia TaxID=5888 RepID=A0CQA7_PARTE|nr:uncharacterized protein GSPATT00009322001 [Paramecium tetraurelia]CAK72974.1 unnamed protein product [Paramecium tetraurelia]|eukprot:XP_001440371.1 hypothetical protein (macronuclear) [Paramecium tetraurelia strain d4-2]
MSEERLLQEETLYSHGQQYSQQKQNQGNVDEHQFEVQENEKDELLKKLEALESKLKNTIDDKPYSELMRILIWEALGTAFFAYGIVCSRGNDVMLSVYLFGAIFLIGKITGGHVNPAVSMSFYSSNEISAFTMRVYWAAQVGGAIAGALAAFVIVGRVTSPYIETQPIQWMVADFCGEALGTFVFCLFIHIQVHPQTQLTENNLIGIGIIATALYFGRILTFHTGGCLNPAMGVGLGIFESLQDGNWDRLINIWIYIFGPLSGASLASEFYRSVYVGLLPKKK